MRHGWLLASLLLVCGLLGGCAKNPIINAETSPRASVEMALTGQPANVIHVRITRPDETVIDAWGLKKNKEAPAKGTVVLIHGMDETKADYCRIAQNLSKEGFDVVFPDLRGYGNSTGKYTTCGAKEKYDVKAVVDDLIKKEKFAAKPIYVFGTDLGAAVAIQYAAIEPNIAGVVAFAPWKDTVSKAKRNMGLATEDELRDKLEEAGELADFDPWATSALLDAKKLKCPVLLIHNALDLVVPVDDSKAIYNTLNSPKELKLITPGDLLAVGFLRDNWVPEQIQRVRKKDFGKAPTTQPK